MNKSYKMWFKTEEDLAFCLLIVYVVIAATSLNFKIHMMVVIGVQYFFNLCYILNFALD